MTYDFSKLSDSEIVGYVNAAKQSGGAGKTQSELDDFYRQADAELQSRTTKKVLIVAAIVAAIYFFK